MWQMLGFHKKNKSFPLKGSGHPCTKIQEYSVKTVPVHSADGSPHPTAGNSQNPTQQQPRHFRFLKYLLTPGPRESTRPATYADPVLISQYLSFPRHEFRIYVRYLLSS